MSGRRHGGVELAWLGDVMLVVTYGDFNYEAALQVAEDMRSAALAHDGRRWALLGITTIGSIPTPDAMVFFKGLVTDLHWSGCRCAALITASSLQDTIYGDLYRAAGIRTCCLRRLAPAVEWLQARGYAVELAEVMKRLPADADWDHLENPGSGTG